MHMRPDASNSRGTWNARGLRPPRPVAIVALSALLALAVGRAQPGAVDQPPPAGRQAPASPPSYERAQLVLPAGDAAAGRQAFQDLKCTVCHRVAGEAAFPAPVAGSQGPTLDSRLSARAASDVVNAIVAPSHSISLRVSAELKKQLAGTTLSPMGDFTRAMTIRQLSDLLAYLRSIKATV